MPDTQTAMTILGFFGLVWLVMITVDNLVPGSDQPRTWTDRRNRALSMLILMGGSAGLLLWVSN